MEFKTLLIAAAITAGGQAAAFEWQPTITQPNPALDVTQQWQLNEVNLHCYESGATITDVMPYWTDEDGNRITATAGTQDPWKWDRTQFVYTFNQADFKHNGEYILTFPAGMILNADGAGSDMVETAYSFDIPELAGAMFDDFAVLTVTPSLDEAQGIWDNQEFTVDTNHNDAIGLTKLTVTDTTTGDVLLISSNFTTGREPGDSNAITWTVGGTHKFYDGHTYNAEFTFYNGKDERGSMGELTPIVDKATFSFTGKVESYRYSDIKLESVTPEPGIVTIARPEEAVIRYVFSGPVTVYKAESPLGQFGIHSYSDECLSSNEDNTVWTLDLSEEPFMLSQDASVTINIYVRDTEGYQLKGNFGSESLACYQHQWNCELGATGIEMVSPALGSVIDELNEIRVKSTTGETMEWTWNASAKVMNMSREVVGTLVYEMAEEASSEIVFTKWTNAYGAEEPIHLVKGGSYAVIFDHGCFIFGEDEKTILSHSLSSSFQITGNLDEPTPGGDEQEVFNYISASIPDGSSVTELSELNLKFPEDVGLMSYEADVINCRINDSGMPGVIGKANLDLDWGDYAQINITLREPITEPGEYMIFIQKRTIGNEAFCDSMGERGICNPDIALYYRIDPSGAGVVEAESAKTVYDLQGRVVLRNASAADVNSLAKGIYVMDGKKVTVK